ncbi:hypothetical protein J5U18_06915 [Sphingobacteriaceae bacterium WQ 2009]|uniref:Lipoprotein n=1 Tax=Rhinopithecimicrobium faecis TaxID=2820698 RepID=A0A8T4HA38_9SPHI|nr:hypothetical protein [Sphingobacteriaceae bacterium WQ 2009]
MKKYHFITFLSIIGLFLLQSCSTNYLTHIASTSDLRQNNKGTFIYENDTLKVFYRFFGLDGPLQTRIVNKLQSPLLVDLQQSSFVFNGKAYSFLGNEITTNNYLPAQEIRILAGQHYDSEGLHLVDFVPLAYNPDSLKGDFVMGTKGQQIKAKTVSFDTASTPLLLQNYISYKVEGINTEYVDQMQSFYIQKIAQIKNVKLADLQAVAAAQSNVFMIRKTKSNKYISTIGIGLISSGLSIGFGVGGVAF